VTLAKACLSFVFLVLLPKAFLTPLFFFEKVNITEGLFDLFQKVDEVLRQLSSLSSSHEDL